MFNKLLFKFLNKHQESRFLHFLFNKFSNNGFQEEEASEKDWIFGFSSAKKEMLREDGQWDEFLPVGEIQKGRYTDTMACVSFSFNNVIEILGLKKWAEKFNKSDRFLAKASNTRRNGNTMRNVADACRNKGAVSEAVWPFDLDKFTWNEYYKTIPPNVNAWAKEFTETHDIAYDSLFYINSKTLKEALKYSPVWVAGYAWYKSGEYYRNYGRANHAFLIYGYEEGKYWKVFDSYEPYTKKLAWNFRFYYAKTIYLGSKDEAQKKINSLINRGLKYIMRSDVIGGGRGQIYELSKDGLREINDDDKINDEEKQMLRDSWVKEQIKNKILTGLSEKDFDKLTK